MNSIGKDCQEIINSYVKDLETYENKETEIGKVLDNLFGNMGKQRRIITQIKYMSKIVMRIVLIEDKRFTIVDEINDMRKDLTPPIGDYMGYYHHCKKDMIDDIVGIIETYKRQKKSKWNIKKNNLITGTYFLIQ
jgi:hypothetical protein